MQIKDRIKELRRVKASELLPNPKNWRRHPASQGNALRGVLSEIGYADALIAYETTDGLKLIDGHLRAETTPDMEVPVLVTDLNEEEADKLLATLDPLAAMASRDQDSLLSLLGTLDVQNDSVRLMLDALVVGENEFLPDLEGTPTLDSLTEEYGEYDPSGLWSEIRMKVPPELKAHFDIWLANGEGINEVEKLGYLLGYATDIKE